METSQGEICTAGPPHVRSCARSDFGICAVDLPGPPGPRVKRDTDTAATRGDTVTRRHDKPRADTTRSRTTPAAPRVYRNCSPVDETARHATADGAGRPADRSAERSWPSVPYVRCARLDSRYVAFPTIPFAAPRTVHGTVPPDRPTARAGPGGTRAGPPGRAAPSDSERSRRVGFKERKEYKE